MKNKKIKFGAALALLGAVVGTTACIANTQLNVNKSNSVANESTWTESLSKLVNGTDVKGSVVVELYGQEQKAIKLVSVSDAAVDNGIVAYELLTKYDGAVRVETLGANLFKGLGYVMGSFNASGIVNIDEAALMGTGITQLTISKDTKFIGENAFNGCNYLTSIVVENATACAPNIAANAFANCPNLAEIKLSSVASPAVYAAWTFVASEISKQVGHEVKVVIA